jgi:hypothetical protein
VGIFRPRPPGCLFGQKKQAALLPVPVPVATVVERPCRWVRAIAGEPYSTVSNKSRLAGQLVRNFQEGQDVKEENFFVIDPRPEAALNRPKPTWKEMGLAIKAKTDAAYAELIRKQFVSHRTTTRPGPPPSPWGPRSTPIKWRCTMPNST